MAGRLTGKRGFATGAQRSGSITNVASVASSITGVAAAIYMASNDSAFTTGTIMVVDGGQTL